MFTLLALQLVLAMAFEYDFQAHDHSEALDELAVAHGLSFHSKALSGVRGRGISTGEYRRGNSPAGRPHWSGSLSFNGHQPQNWNGPQGGLFPQPSVAG